MTWQLRLGYAALILIAWLSVAMAVTTVLENGDAGDLPNMAQDATGITLDADGIMEVRGRIESTSNVDMYRIEITEPGEFSAITIFDTNVSIEDSQLFLFDADGRGVCANEDNPDLLSTDPLRLYAALPRGGCQIPARGFYFLAISTSVRDPLSDLNNPNSEIFPDVPRQAILAPLDPNAIVQGWLGPSEIGNYAFQLTGINDPPPDCFASQSTLNPDGTRTITLQTQDERVGIQSITEVSRSDNITEVDIPDFQEGTMEVITVTATDQNPNMPSQVQIEVTNTRGVSRTCTLSAPQLPEQPAMAPSCVDVFSLEGLPAVETTVQDTESGLSLIRLLFAKNATVTVDGDPLPTADGEDFIAFNPPTTDPVVIRVEKIDLNERATVLVEVFDNDIPSPNSDICDPILFQLIVPNKGLVVEHTYNDVPEFDHHITVQNGNGTPGSGLMLMTIKVNDAPAKIFRLSDGEVKQFNVEAEMIPGLNTMTFKGIGPPGSEASIAVSNQQPQIAPLAASGSSSFIVRRSSVKGQVNRAWGGQ